MGLNHLTRASSTLARVRARYTFNNATTLSRSEACWATRPNLVVVRRSFSTRGNLLMIDNSPAISASLVPPSIRDLQDQDQPVQKDARIQDDFDDIRQGRGKLSPTSSHLFKLILPLGGLDLPADERKSLYTPSSSSKRRPTPPTIMLLHPSQPLSHVASLIRNSIRSGSDKSRRANPGPDVTFVSTSTRGQPYQWSETTDIGDFVRDAARRKSFSVELDFSDAEFLPEPESEAKSPPRVTSIEVDVPTFQDRTSFLRRRLFHIQSQLQQMEGLKVECDRMAHKGAKRLAIGGFGMLVVYWGAVARLTFWDYGWDVMEPVTYLSGLTTVVCGYLWFLYQGRDVSYTSVLHRSVDARKEALYREKGFDIERWSDLKDEERGTRREIGRIAEEYDVQTDDGETEDRKRTNGGNGKGEKDEDEEEGECGVSKKVEEAGDEIEKKIESVEEVEDGAEDKKRN